MSGRTSVEPGPGDALRTFLDWRPGPACGSRGRVGGAAISLALTAALCVALLAVTALVGGGAGSHGWSLGHGLLLLCHLG